MSNKPGRDRPQSGGSVPHPSWNLDRSILFASRDGAREEHAGERRRVTPEEIWAVVDAVN